MTFVCEYCGKTYENKKFYNKHYLKCRSLNNYEEDEFEILPSISSLYKLVKHLVKENNQLKKRVNRLENNARNKNNHKVNIIDWLNKSGNTILEIKYVGFDEFLKKFNNNISNFWNSVDYFIEKLENLDMLEMYLSIINDILYNNDIFISFKNTKKIYYLKENKWEYLELKNLYKLIQKIQKNMICDFMNYQMNHKIDLDRFNNLSSKIYGNFNSDKNLDILYGKISNSINKEISRETNIKIIY